MLQEANVSSFCYFQYYFSMYHVLHAQKRLQCFGKCRSMTPAWWIVSKTKQNKSVHTLGSRMYIWERHSRIRSLNSLARRYKVCNCTRVCRQRPTLISNLITTYFHGKSNSFKTDGCIILLIIFDSLFLCYAQLAGSRCHVQLLSLKFAWGVDSAVSMVEALPNPIPNRKFWKLIYIR